MAQASHSADRSLVPSSSCLVSSHLISLPLLSPSFLLFPSLYHPQMPSLCSAVWHLQSDSFTLLLSPRGYYIPFQSSTQCAHTYTHIITIENHLHWAFGMWKKAGLSEPLQPWWWNSRRWVTLLTLFFSFSLFFFWWRIWHPHGGFEITFLITLNEYIFSFAQEN